MRINDPNWYPSYLNPTFDEIVELAKSGWDTIRILIDGDNLMLGSGLGNTHESIAARYRIHLGRKRLPLCTPFILHHRNGYALFNLEDVSGPERARAGDYIDWLEPYQEILKDLIRESGLSL